MASPPASQTHARARRAVAAAVAAACGLAGCSGSDGGTAATAPAAQAQAQTMRAEAVATQEFGLLSGGGWAAAWNLWAAADQHLVGESVYVRVNTACPLSLGVPYVIEKTAPAGAGTMRVVWKHGTTTGTNLLVEENGSWRFVPDTAEVAQYRLGPGTAVAQRRAAGRCR